MKEKKQQKWEELGFSSKADWLDSILEERKIDFGNKTNQLVCIANIETGEVLRISYLKAQTAFLEKKDSTWKLTTKSVYKQYVESKVPNSKIPAPVFITEKGELQHVFTGHPSYRVNKRNSTSNKKGKFRFQKIEANKVFNKETEELEDREARVIKHKNF